MQAIIIFQAISAALAAAPQAAELINQAKQFVQAVFTAKVITIEEQDALMAYLNAQEQLRKSGIVPPHWVVRPDPQ